MGFCTTCGGALDPGAKFCTNCGMKAYGGESAGGGSAVQAAPETPRVAEVAQLAPVISAPQSYPESPFYPDAPKQSSGGLGKGITVIAVIVIVGCAIAYYFLSPRKPHGPAPIIDGTQTSAVFAVQTFGLERYPGARPVSANSSDAEQVLAAFETNDTPAQVIGYYRVRFPVAQLTIDPTHPTLSADMNDRQVLITADALVHGSRVRISMLRNTPAK
jgi:hypothetical protein